MDLFSNLPPIEYQGRRLRNILYRPRLLETLDTTAFIFYPYIVEEGERLDTVAYWYYDSPDFAWLVALANDIVDPYYDWVLTSKDLDRYIINKYGSREAAAATVLYKKDQDGNQYSPDTTAALLQGSSSTINDVTPTLTEFTALDYEYEENEKKRHIQLIDKIYIPQIISELRNLYNE